MSIGKWKRAGLVLALGCVLLAIGVMVRSANLAGVDGAETNVFTLDTTSGIDDFEQY